MILRLDRQPILLQECTFCIEWFTGYIFRGCNAALGQFYLMRLAVAVDCRSIIRLVRVADCMVRYDSCLWRDCETSIISVTVCPFDCHVSNALQVDTRPSQADAISCAICTGTADINVDGSRCIDGELTICNDAITAAVATIILRLGTTDGLEGGVPKNSHISCFDAEGCDPAGGGGGVYIRLNHNTSLKRHIVFCGGSTVRVNRSNFSVGCIQIKRQFTAVWGRDDQTVKFSFSTIQTDAAELAAPDGTVGFHQNFQGLWL